MNKTQDTTNKPKIEHFSATEGEDTRTRNQAKAWNLIVAEMICDFGLEHTEPGEVMIEQVQHFLRRKLKPVAEGEARRAWRIVQRRYGHFGISYDIWCGDELLAYELRLEHAQKLIAAHNAALGLQDKAQDLVSETQPPRGDITRGD